MKITQILIFQVDLPLNTTFTVPGGRPLEKLDSTIVAVQTDVGITGWGEICPFGSLSAFGEGIRAAIAVVAPALLGQDPRHLDVINREMDQALPGHPHSKSPLDVACWDILGRAAGLPLYALLGGKMQSGVALRTKISIGTPDEMVEGVQEARASGYTHFSAGIGSNLNDDLARMMALLENTIEEESLAFNAHGAWLTADATTAMQKMANQRVMITQPCQTLDQCHQVRELTQQPIYLDQSIASFDDLLRAHRQNVCHGVTINIGRVGGITHARRMRDFCLAAGIRMSIEDAGGSKVADTAALHLALATPAEYFHAAWDCSPYHGIVTAIGGYRRENGQATLTDAPGLGIVVNRDVLGEPVAVYNLEK
ncbi:MAG: mandelate racemase/muconate lactonizing enzyme family protein [Ardenticatenaceae bacterium]|nr:mandelate racemase/muconate lactonizing enzyme family protein [Ardenticatenaceae bacterium]